MAHPIAPFLTALAPPRTASAPPVKKPAMMAFHGSSFLRMPLTAQSKVLNMPPQTPKLPPRTGARALIAVRAGGLLGVCYRKGDGGAGGVGGGEDGWLGGWVYGTSYSSFTVGTVSETLDSMPYCCAIVLVRWSGEILGGVSCVPAPPIACDIPCQ